MNIYVVDDDPEMRATLALLFEEVGHPVQTFSGGGAFLSVASELTAGCAVLDLCLPDMDGLTVQAQLAEQGSGHAVVMMSGYGEVPDAVTAMRLGALDFLRKPFRIHELLAAVGRARALLDRGRTRQDQVARLTALADLSRREMDVLKASAGGAASKAAAFTLGLSVRTVEMHRANIIRKLHVANFGAALLLAQRNGLID